MKKGLTVVLIISMLFTMSACTKKDNSRKTDGKNEKNESVELKKNLPNYMMNLHQKQKMLQKLFMNS